MSKQLNLVFASANKHKLQEVQSLLHGLVTVSLLADAGITEEIPENETTIEGNALTKARFVFNRLYANCFADDTGLIVDALNGEPGVYSARYAGDEADADKNIIKLLNKLKKESHRKARFITVIALILNGKEHIFKGSVEGVITGEKRGEGGFGYDPVFVPDGYKKTFAEMTPEEKNSISHRARALQAMKEFLTSLYRNNF